MFGDKGCMLQSNFSESSEGLSTICGDVIEQQRSVLMFFCIILIFLMCLSNMLLDIKMLLWCSEFQVKY